MAVSALPVAGVPYSARGEATQNSYFCAGGEGGGRVTCGQPTGSEDTGLQPLGRFGEQGVSRLEAVGSEGRGRYQTCLDARNAGQMWGAP